MKLFIPLAKVDEAQRIVVGRAVQEIPDKSGEILDYATAKPAFQEWSDQISRLSNGLSKGNVRVQHDPKSAVGKVIDMTFDDDAKAIDVCVKVVDDNAWAKVREGVYTGFSVGGSYGAKWQDPATGLRKYTPKVTELSLVDNPCIPTAAITLVKADGSTAEIRPRPVRFGEALEELVKAAAGPPSFLGELRKLTDAAPSPRPPSPRPMLRQALASAAPPSRALPSGQGTGQAPRAAPLGKAAGDRRASARDAILGRLAKAAR